MKQQLVSFLFDDYNVRGAIVCLDEAYQDVVNRQSLPVVIGQLLGEFSAALVLMSCHLKLNGRVSLQARGSGPVSLLVAETTSDLKIRAMAHCDQDRFQDSVNTLDDWLGHAHLALTIMPDQGEQYQGLVPMEKPDLAGCLEGYFAQSEQLPTWFRLFADGERAVGLMLQQLPGDADSSLVTPSEDDFWLHATTLADTLSLKELIELPVEEILHRLFHEESVRLFEPKEVRFGCSCSRENFSRAVAAIGLREIDALYAEQGEIRVNCEFCGSEYTFTPQDRTLLAGDVDSAPEHLH